MMETQRRKANLLLGDWMGNGRRSQNKLFGKGGGGGKEYENEIMALVPEGSVGENKRPHFFFLNFS